MFESVASLWQLFKAGEAVEDPTKWKSRQITVTAVGAVILAAVHVIGTFGYELPIDEKSADQIGGGILAIVNIVLSITTNREIGLRAGTSATDSQ